MESALEALDKVCKTGKTKIYIDLLLHHYFIQIWNNWKHQKKVLYVLINTIANMNLQ